MVPIDLQPTARTRVDSVGQRHLLPMSTPTTVLTCVGRTHSYQSPASICRFVGDELSKLRPSCIGNRLCETVVMNHPVDFEVFDADHPKPVDDLSTFLVGKVAPPVPDPFVDTGNCLARPLSRRSALLSLGEFSLFASQVFLVTPEKLGGRDGFGCRESSEGEKADIYTYGFKRSRQRSSLHLAGEADEPLTGSRFLDHAGLGSAFERPMENDSHLAKLGKLKNVAFELPAEAGLREGEAIIAVVAPEARIAGLFPVLESAEEGLKC